MTLFLIFGWVSLSAVGYLKKDSVYRKYTVDGRYTPYFVLVMQGVHDGIFPWSSEPTDFWEKWGWEGKWSAGEVLAAGKESGGGSGDATAQNPGNGGAQAGNGDGPAGNGGGTSGDSGLADQTSGNGGENGGAQAGTGDGPAGNGGENGGVQAGNGDGSAGNGGNGEGNSSGAAGVPGNSGEDDGVSGQNPGSGNGGAPGTGPENGSQDGGAAGPGGNRENGTESGGAESQNPQDGGQEQRGFVNVDESYFDDAVFIGDSRTVGLHDYSGLTNATFFATVGMNVYDVWTEAFCEADGKKMTLEEALSLRQYKKVYFQIGINEMGTGTVDSFLEAYAQSVLRLKELQPDAIIFVQGIMRVAKEKSDTDPIFNNQGINARNARIAALADNRTIFYIDVNEVVCDEEGNLRSDLTFDGLHLLGSKYGIWVEFLKTRGIAVE